MSQYAIGGGVKDATGNLVVGLKDASLDAFSRLRVSNPQTLFDSSFIYDLQPLVFETITANGGTVTHSANDSSASLALDGTAGGSAALQSRRYIRYVPGKSQQVILTFVMGAATASAVKRVGFFDTNDGLYLEQNGTTDIAVVRRTSTSGSPVNNRVVQASWNLDVMDGTGPSRKTLDLSKCQILVIDFQWLGMGRVRFGFDIDGEICYVHEFLNANVLTTVYMKRGTLPVRWEIAGTATASMLATCSSVNSEGGGGSAFSEQFAYDRASVTAGNGTPVYAFSIRPKATFNSITNRINIQPVRWKCAVTGNNPVLVEIYFDTTVAGSPSWADMNTTYSALQVDTAGTPSGGIKIDSFTVGATTTGGIAAATPALSRYPLVMDAAGTGYTNMTVYVTGLGNTSACRPGLIWNEDR